MRLELMDPYGSRHPISTLQHGLIALWLNEWAGRAKTYGWSLTIQPETPEESQVITAEQFSNINSTTIRKLATKLGEKKYMATARWCDFHDHAYRAPDDPDDINVVKFAGNAKEICPECAAEIGLNDEYRAPEPPATRHEAITSAKGK
jgi:hypothetical protein